MVKKIPFFILAERTLTNDNGIAVQSSVIPVTRRHAINSSRALPAEITGLIFAVHYDRPYRGNTLPGKTIGFPHWLKLQWCQCSAEDELLAYNGIEDKVLTASVDDESTYSCIYHWMYKQESFLAAYGHNQQNGIELIQNWRYYSQCSESHVFKCRIV